MDVETLLTEVQHINTMMSEDPQEAKLALQDLEDELVDEIFGCDR